MDIFPVRHQTHALYYVTCRSINQDEQGEELSSEYASKNLHLDQVNKGCQIRQLMRMHFHSQAADCITSIK